VLVKHILPAENYETGEAADSSFLVPMVDNWMRLGLVEVSYGQVVGTDKDYIWVESSPTILALKEKYKDDEGEVGVTHGLLSVTSFGENFARSVGILPPDGD